MIEYDGKVMCGMLKSKANQSFKVSEFALVRVCVTTTHQVTIFQVNHLQESGRFNISSTATKHDMASISHVQNTDTYPRQKTNHYCLGGAVFTSRLYAGKCSGATMQVFDWVQFKSQGRARKGDSLCIRMGDTVREPFKELSITVEYQVCGVVATAPSWSCVFAIQSDDDYEVCVCPARMDVCTLLSHGMHAVFSIVRDSTVPCPHKWNHDRLSW